jgi:hypothetical protein
MATTNKIVIGIDDQVIELKGADKEAFLADIEKMPKANILSEEQIKAKEDARNAAIKKLGEIAGLTTDELNAIL